MHNSSHIYYIQNLEKNPYASLKLWFESSKHESVLTLISRTNLGFSINHKISHSKDELNLNTKKVENFYDYTKLYTNNANLEDSESPSQYVAIDQLLLRAYILRNQDKVDFAHDEKGVFKFISIYLTEHGIKAIQKLRSRTLYDERSAEKFNELDLIRNYLCKVLNSINLADDKFTKQSRNNFYLKNNKDLQNFMFRQIVRSTVCIEDDQETEFFPSDLTELILLVDPEILSNNEDFLIDAINYSTDIVHCIYQQYKHHDINKAALISDKHNYFITNILEHNIIDDDMVRQFLASEPMIIEEEYKRFNGNKLQNALIRKVITSCPLQTIDKLIPNNTFKEDELSLDVFMDSFKLFAKFLTIFNKSQGINQSKQNEVFNEKHSDLMHKYRKQAFVDIEFSDPVDQEFANSSDISDDDLAPKCKSQKSQDQTIYISNKQSHKKSRKRSTQTFNFPDLLENDYSLESDLLGNASIQLSKPPIIIWTNETVDKYIQNSLRPQNFKQASMAI